MSKLSNLDTNFQMCLFFSNGGRFDIRDRLDEIHVRCGEHNVKEDNTAFPIQESTVTSIEFHPDYNPKRIWYNLAILVTEYNFVYQKHIGPVCLPRPGQNFDGQVCAKTPI